MEKATKPKKKAIHNEFEKVKHPLNPKDSRSRCKHCGKDFSRNAKQDLVPHYKSCTSVTERKNYNENGDIATEGGSITSDENSPSKKRKIDLSERTGPLDNLFQKLQPLPKATKDLADFILGLWTTVEV